LPGLRRSGSGCESVPSERLAFDAGPQKTVEKFAVEIAAGEPPTELGKVPLKVLRGNSVVNASEVRPAVFAFDGSA
jgi:hypothetical protein